MRPEDNHIYLCFIMNTRHNDRNANLIVPYQRLLIGFVLILYVISCHQALGRPDKRTNDTLITNTLTITSGTTINTAATSTTGTTTTIATTGATTTGATTNATTTASATIWTTTLKDANAGIPMITPRCCFHEDDNTAMKVILFTVLLCLCFHLFCCCCCRYSSFLIIKFNDNDNKKR